MLVRVNPRWDRGFLHVETKLPLGIQNLASVSIARIHSVAANPPACILIQKDDAQFSERGDLPSPHGGLRMRGRGGCGAYRRNEYAAAKFYVPFESPAPGAEILRTGGRRVNSLPAFAHRQQNDLQVLGVGFGRRSLLRVQKPSGSA